MRYPSTFRSSLGTGVFLALFALASLPGQSAESTETGVIPYRAIAAIYEGFAQLEPKEKLVLSVRILPTSKVKPGSEIELQIRSRQGVIPLKRTAAGDLQNFPWTQELRQENPEVVSNQPKGSLLLKAAIGVRYSGKRVEKAAWYRDALNQANAALKLQGGRFSLVTPSLKSLTFNFDPGSRASLQVRVSGQEQEFRADELGKARLEVGRDLPSDNADLILSEIPLSISAE